MCICLVFVFFFFFKQKTAYEIGVRLVGSEMCIRDRHKKAGGVSVGMRTAGFENSSRQMQLESSTDVTEEIYRAAWTLLMLSLIHI